VLLVPESDERNDIRPPEDEQNENMDDDVSTPTPADDIPTPLLQGASSINDACLLSETSSGSEDERSSMFSSV
jgi:hypothetical protein